MQTNLSTTQTLRSNARNRRAAYQAQAIDNALAAAQCLQSGDREAAAYFAGMAALAMECEDRATHATAIDC